MDLDSIRIASCGNTNLSAQGFLAHLHLHGRLQSLLGEALIEEFLVQQAKQAGLTISDEELQQAADLARRRQGLTSAETTQRWLAGQHWTVDAFEAAIERELLLARFQQHVTREDIAPHFDAHRAEYDWVRLRQIVVARQDLARELLSQLNEGADFPALAAEHSLVQGDKTAVLTVQRGELPATIADPVFAAREGDVVGPLASALGFSLFRIEEKGTAALDEKTTKQIGEQLFRTWLNNRLKEHPLRFHLVNLP